MAENENWEIKKHLPSEINEGKKYKVGDDLSLEAINSIVENSFYASEQSTSSIGTIELSSTTGTLTDDQYNNLINNNYLLQYENELYIKSVDTGSTISFSKIVSISNNNNELLLLNTNYFIITKSQKTYSKVSSQYQTYSKTKIDNLISGITITFDDELSTTSENGVQNKVITNALNNKQNLISSTNKLDADLVDDSNSDNKFVSSTDITNWNNKANDNSVVHKTGNEDIYGLKTFDVRPQVGIEQELPSEYSQLDYIQATGSQYLNLELKKFDIDKAEIDISFDTVDSNQQVVIGTTNYNDGTKTAAMLTLTNTYLSYIVAGTYSGVNTYSSSLTPTVGERYKLISNYNVNAQSLYLGNDLLTSSTTGTNNNTTTHYYLLASHKLDYIYHSAEMYTYGKLYSCKLYKNNTLIRNFVPVKRVVDSVAGLYDFVTETFYPSSSASNFVAGPETIPSDDSLVMLKGDIQANETLDGTESNLTSLDIKGTKYNIPQGTTVIANPTLSGSESDLTGIQVGNTKYKVPSGGGGSTTTIVDWSLGGNT